LAKAEPWQAAEIPGPAKALVITKPEVVVAMVRRARRPILIVGHEAAETDLGGERAVDHLIRVARAGKIPVVATAHILGEFLKRRFRPAASMSAVDIANRLRDPGWKGLDGKGPYDLALIAGVPYPMGWVILSGLKHFSGLRTVSMDPYYHPQASWSLPNLSREEWEKHLKTVGEKLGGK